MKKYLCALSLVILLAFFLEGCQQSNSTDPIVGTWVMTSPTPGGVTITIQSNETWTAVTTIGGPSPQSGTWSVSGGVYTIVDITTSSTYTGTVSGNTLTITVSVSQVQTFARQ